MAQVLSKPGLVHSTQGQSYCQAHVASYGPLAYGHILKNWKWMKIVGCTKYYLLITIYKSQWVETGVSNPLEESEQKEVYIIVDHQGVDHQCDHGSDEADEVAEDDSLHSAPGVGEPSKEDHARDGSDEEEGLGQGGDPCLVTHPVLLHGQRDMAQLASMSRGRYPARSHLE